MIAFWATATVMPAFAGKPACTIEVPVENPQIRQYPVDAGTLRLGRFVIPEVGQWRNKANVFRKRPVVITLDMAEPAILENLVLESQLPERWSITRADVSLSDDGTKYDVLTTQEGPPASTTEERQFKMAVNGTGQLARFIRVRVFPGNYWNLSIGKLEIRIRNPAAVTPIRRLEDDLAFYEPDGPFPEDWQIHWSQEKWRDFLPGIPKIGGPGAYIKAYFHNRSKKPWQVNTLRINGVSVDDHLHQSKKDKQYTSIHIDADESSAGYKTLVEMGEPVWYKAEPRVVPPGEQTEVVLRLRRPPQDAFKLEIATAAGLQETEVIPLRPACDIEAIDFTDGRREIFIYARRWREVAGTVVAILVDGRLAVDVRAGQLGWLPRGNDRPAVAAYRVRVPEPLERGSFHTIAFVTDSGQIFRTQARAWVNPFLIGTFVHVSPIGDSLCGRLRRLNFNTIFWGRGDADVQRDHGLYQWPNRPKRKPDPSNLSELGWFSQDEPDVEDYFANEVKDHWRRLGSSAPGLAAGRRRNIEQIPYQQECIIIDSTFVPLNYATYAQLCDIPWTDRYAPKWQKETGDLQFHPHAVYATASTLAAHCEPKPHMNLLYASGNANLGFLRYPTPDEELLMASYALAAGAKGIGYWWWQWLGRRPDLQRGIAQVNARLRQIGGLVARSIVTGWSVVNSEQAMTEALWTAGEGVVVLVMNEDYKVEKEGFTSTSTRNVQVQCRLPPGGEQWRVFEVTPGGWKLLASDQYRITPGGAGEASVQWEIAELRVANWFVIAAE